MPRVDCRLTCTYRVFSVIGDYQEANQGIHNKKKHVQAYKNQIKFQTTFSTRFVSSFKSCHWWKHSKATVKQVQWPIFINQNKVVHLHCWWRNQNPFCFLLPLLPIFIRSFRHTMLNVNIALLVGLHQAKLIVYFGKSQRIGCCVYILIFTSTSSFDESFVWVYVKACELPSSVVERGKQQIMQFTL